ncbi:MAG: FliH/SctL family protein [Planctomycetota bacterium]|jgi:flagellar biosynthesis/type III secretory pathway protein FliH|nr:hypothetical protein [Blastopirellula sp.]
MAKFQMQLPRTVKVAVPVSHRESMPLPVRVIEESPPGALATPSQEEERLRQEVTQLETDVLGIVRRLNDALQELSQAEAKRLVEYRLLALRLAMIATRAVLREVNQTTDQRLEQLITDGLEQIPGREQVTVRLNPGQCDRIAYHFESVGGQRPVNFQPDGSIPRGEVQLDHPMFSLASNLTEQLDQLEQALAEELQH